MARSGAVVAAIVGALTLSAATSAASWSGTWTGHAGAPKDVPLCPGNTTPVGCMPRSFLALTTYRFTFRNSGIDYYGVGPTPASHDSTTAKGWCRMRLIFDHDAAGWTYYKAAGLAKFAGEGGPGVFCQTSPLRFSVSALRLRQAGAKLKVEFGELQIPSSYGEAHAYLSRVR